MIRNINQSHYTPGVANLYNSWEWDQSRFFYLTSWITGYTHHMLTADTALCIKRQSENRKKNATMHLFWEGLHSYRNTGTFVRCRLKEGTGWQSCIALANLQQSTNAIRVPRQPEDATGDAPTDTAPECRTSVQICPVLCNAPWRGSYENCMFQLLGLECSHWTFWVLVYILHISKASLPCKPSNSLRSLVQNYKESIKENSSLSSCNFLSFSKMKKCSCSY